MAETKTVVNQAKITDMVNKIVTLDGTFIVDINKQIHYATSPDTPIFLSNKGDKGSNPLYIYDTNIKDPDAIILNPLAEGSSTGKERLFFYAALSISLGQWIFRILKLMISNGLNTDIQDPAFVPIISTFVNDFDEKMFEELERIESNGIKNFFHIYYNQSKKTSTLLLGFEDETGDYFKSFPKGKMRKKSWELYLKMVKFILQVPEDQKIKDIYTHSTMKVEYPNFETFMPLWMKAWRAIAQYIPFFEGHEDPTEILDELDEHFKFLPVYREHVMWLTQSTAKNSSEPKVNLNIPVGTQNDNKQVVVADTKELELPYWKKLAGITNTKPTSVTVTTSRSWGRPSTGQVVVVNSYSNRGWR